MNYFCAYKQPAGLLRCGLLGKPTNYTLGQLGVGPAMTYSSASPPITNRKIAVKLAASGVLKTDNSSGIRANRITTTITAIKILQRIAFMNLRFFLVNSTFNHNYQQQQYQSRPTEEFNQDLSDKSQMPGVILKRGAIWP